MTVEQLVEKFKEKPYMLEMGRGKLSKYLKASKDDIVLAKKIVRLENKHKGIKKLPKILILDIETAPLKAHIWSYWKQSIYQEDQLLSDWFMLTWSAKWLYDSTTMSAGLTGIEAIEERDARIVKQLWDLLNEADIVIAHNGNKFDLPKINSRFIVNGLPPTSPYQSIDTLLVARKQFGFSSNKLDSLAKKFGFKPKLSTGFALWRDCVEGNEESLAYMEEYNRHDVVLLEEVYLKLRPWIKSHPNVALYIESDKPVCANCGSSNLTKEGTYYTQAGKFQTHRCECGAISRVRQNSFPKDKRKQMLISTAR